MRRQLSLALAVLWVTACVICLVAAVLAIAHHQLIAVPPSAFLAASGLAMVWWRTIPPHGPAARAAYHELEAAIHTAPPDRVYTGNTELLAEPRHVLPQLHRWVETDYSGGTTILTETYVLLWAPPLVVRYAETNWIDDELPDPGDVDLRSFYGFLWQTLRTGHGFATPEQMQALATELRASSASMQPEG